MNNGESCATSLQQKRTENTDDKTISDTRGRKRKRNIAQWKKNVRKNSRLQGKTYIRNSGKMASEVKEGPSCNCSKKCFHKIKAGDRKNFRHRFYSLPDFTSQRLYISNCISVSQPARKYTKAENSRRTKTFLYKIAIDGEEISVCKQALVSILGITVSRLQYICELIKQHGTPPEDKRGKHNNRPNKIPYERREMVRIFINSLPKYKSHYTRRHNPNREYLSPLLTERKLYTLYQESMAHKAQEPVSFRVFCDIFTKEFNIHFGHPKLDTCQKCDKLRMQVIEEGQQEYYNTEKEIHLRKAESAQTAMREDFKNSKNGSAWCITFDLQQTLPTPHINTSVAFYCRQLWTYNLGIHDSNDDGFMMMWSEDVGGRGSEDIISALNAYIEHVPVFVKKVIAWSDSCGGQNKNKNVLSFWYYLVHGIQRFDEIEHKFPVPGHSFLNSDRDFAVIEKKKREVPAIYNPEGWYKLVEGARVKKPFRVVRMTRDKFVSVSLIKDVLVYRNKTEDGHAVEFQKAARFKISKDHPGKYMISYSHTMDEWEHVNILRKGRQSFQQLRLPRLYPSPRRISQEKKRDLIKLCPYIPVEYREFYQNMLAKGLSPVKLRRTIKKRHTTESIGTDIELDSESE